MANEEQNKMGRPTVVTPEVLLKLEQAFSYGATDLEACGYAKISKSTLYYYQQDNPDFLERKEELKSKPILKARRVVIQSLETDPHLALKFLERKKKDEFGLRHELTGVNGEPLIIENQLNNDQLKRITTTIERLIARRKTNSEQADSGTVH
jgi:hypothetical protein